MTIQKKATGICPSCSEPIINASNSPLQIVDDMRLSHCSCSVCESSVLTIEIGQGAICTSVALLTDLTTEDVVRFLQSSKIQDQDVLSVREIIHTPEFFHHLLYKD